MEYAVLGLAAAFALVGVMTVVEGVRAFRRADRSLADAREALSLARQVNEDTTRLVDGDVPF